MGKGESRGMRELNVKNAFQKIKKNIFSDKQRLWEFTASRPTL